MKLAYIVTAWFAVAPSLSAQVAVPVGTRVPAITPSTISSQTSAKGDKFALQVVSDVLVAGQIVIAKGTAVTGTVTDVKKAGRFGKEGLLLIALDPVVTVDGQHITLMLHLGDTTEITDNPAKAQGKEAGTGKSVKDRFGLSSQGGDMGGSQVTDLAKDAVKGVIGGFRKQGEVIAYEAQSRIPVFTAAYLVVKTQGPPTPAVVDSTAGTAKQDGTIRVRSGGQTDTSGTLGDSTPPVVPPSAIAFFENAHVWDMTLGALLAHQGSTPVIRRLGWQLVRDDSVLQSQALALARRANVPVAPLSTDEQTRLNGVVKTLLQQERGSKFDAEVLQKMYSLEQAFLSETEGLDDDTPMGRLLAKALPVWKKHMGDVARLLAPSSSQRTR